MFSVSPSFLVPVVPTVAPPVGSTTRLLSLGDRVKVWLVPEVYVRSGC